MSQYVRGCLLSAVCCALCAPYAVHVRPAQSGRLFVVIVDGKRGYIDRSGRIVIEPQFRSAGDFSEGLAVVSPIAGEYKLGYIDQTGKVVIEERFDNARDFREGLAAVGFDTEKTKVGCSDCDPNQRWGYIDKTGATVVKPQYHRAGDFSEGMAAVETETGKWGFLNRTGQVVIQPQYGYAAKFSEGLACVMMKKKFGYVDREGRTVIGAKFSSCSDFSEGLARVRVGGRAVSPIRLGSEAGLPGKLRYIDKTGRVAIRLDAESADDFSDGLAAFEVKNHQGELYCGYIDKTGKPAIAPRFDFGECEKFSEGTARILLNGKWSYIDRSGKTLLVTPYALTWEFSHGLAQVQVSSLNPPKSQDAKYGYIDREGVLVWRPTN